MAMQTQTMSITCEKYFLSFVTPCNIDLIHSTLFFVTCSKSNLFNFDYTMKLPILHGQ